MKKFNLSIAAHPEQWNYDLNKFEFFLPKDVSTIVTAFLADWFWRKNIFLKKFFIYLGKYLNPTSEYFEFYNLKHPAYLRFDTWGWFHITSTLETTFLAHGFF